MPYKIPSTRELIDRSISGIESALGVLSPMSDRAFNRAWGTVEGMAQSGIYAFAVDRARENLAISASEEGLENIGNEYDVPRRAAISWRGKARFTLDNGIELYIGTKFVGTNGLIYETTQSAIGGTEPEETITLRCKNAGASGNLAVGDELTIQQTMEGGGRSAVVISVDYLGIEEEEVENYRLRVLDVIRGGTGGLGNSTDDIAEVNIPACVTGNDYRLAAEAIGGVARAYPFAGPPKGIVPKPGQRTVYVECTADIEPDGIAPQSLLDLVRSAIITDPLTGLSREVLGMPAGTDLLFVEPIVRTGIYVTVVNLHVIGTSRSQAEQSLREAIKNMLLSFRPYVQSIDAEFDRMDELTNALLAREIQNTLDVYGGTAEDVFFSDQPSGGMGTMVLGNNEKLKLLQITFQEG